LETYFPRLRRRKTIRRVRRVVTEPLFPRYLFCRFDVTRRLPILTLPGVVHIVGLGRVPAPVDADELESLKLVVQAGLLLNPNEPYTVGEKVCVREGPLAGASGVVVGLKSERLVVSISLLQRSVSVVLDREWIAPESVGRAERKLQ